MSRRRGSIVGSGILTFILYEETQLGSGKTGSKKLKRKRRVIRTYLSCTRDNLMS